MAADSPLQGASSGGSANGNLISAARAAQRLHQSGESALMAQQWAARSTAGGGGGSGAAWPQAARVQELLQELVTLSADGQTQPPSAADAANVDLGACVRHIRQATVHPAISLFRLLLASICPAVTRLDAHNPSV